jgi:threonine dehydratase
VKRPELDEVRAAWELIRDQVHQTPVMTSTTLNQELGGEFFFKCENFQKVGAFKFRGAFHAVQRLSAQDAARGVVTHSSGNHAQALALAARLRGIPAHIVMPENAPAVKRRAVEGYGGRVITSKSSPEVREEKCEEVRLRTGATLVHPYDNWNIIAGAGTAALELIEEVGELDLVVAPLGGGGLLSGTAIATRGLLPDAKIWGAEPANADDAARSLKAGEILPSIHPNTVADGLRTSLGNRNFRVLQELEVQVATCSEGSILTALRWIWERMKLVVEPSSVVPLACMREGTLPVAGKRVGVILSGGNVSLGEGLLR